MGNIGSERAEDLHPFAPRPIKPRTTCRLTLHKLDITGSLSAGGRRTRRARGPPRRGRPPRAWRSRGRRRSLPRGPRPPPRQAPRPRRRTTRRGARPRRLCPEAVCSGRSARSWCRSWETDREPPVCLYCLSLLRS